MEMKKLFLRLYLVRARVGERAGGTPVLPGITD
jgi:hypothetical protein